MATENAPPTDPPAADPAATSDPPATDPPANPPADPPPAAAGAGDPPTDPPADPAVDPAVDPAAEPSAKSKAAAKGHKTRAEKAARRAELAEDPDVRQIVDQATARAKTEAQEAAAEVARRASLSEVERANAEAKDAKDALAESQAQLGQQKLEREYSDAVVESDLKILPNSRKIMRRLVADAMTADPSITASEALTMVAEEYDNLLQPAAAAPGAPSTPQPRRSGATTTPAPKRQTATPTTQEPPKGANVDGMSQKEFIDYRAKTYGIQLPY